MPRTQDIIGRHAQPRSLTAKAAGFGIVGGGAGRDTTGRALYTAHPQEVRKRLQRLRQIDFCDVVRSPQELEDWLDRRLKSLSLAWNTSSS
jgi:hypothetical protein